MNDVNIGTQRCWDRYTERPLLNVLFLIKKTSFKIFIKIIWNIKQFNSKSILKNNWDFLNLFEIIIQNIYVFQLILYWNRAHFKFVEFFFIYIFFINKFFLIIKIDLIFLIRQNYVGNCTMVWVYDF